MNFDNQIESDDDEWFEGLESDENNIDMGSAVQINDPYFNPWVKDTPNGRDRY